MFDQSTLNSAWGNASAAPKQASQPKGPGGIKGFLTNALPAIGSGLGAVAGIPLDIFGGAGSIAGGAAGGALGETLKRKLLGQSLDPKQIAIQAAEGGVGAAVQPLKLLKGASGAAKSFVRGGAEVADNAAAKTAETAGNGGSSFLKNLTTQGQQAQGRISGISAGTKVAGKELTPQDTAQMLTTLKNEGVQTGNANNTLRDVTDKLKDYGQQISDHFTNNDAPLHPDDTKQIANNFISSLKTTDPTVLKQAQIIADDLQKNVNSTKDLWNFRKMLDGKIPDSKFMDEATTAKVTALKSARQYISNELGEVPGMSSYHDLSEIKPFVSAEARRLNNPSGGIVGRVLSSGPAQATENLVGKGTERVGQIGSNAATDELPGAVDSATSSIPTRNPTNILDKVLTKKGIPVKYESDTLVGKGVPENKKVTLTNPTVGNLEDEIGNLKGEGFGVTQRLGSTPGSSLPSGVGTAPDFTPLEQSPKLSSVELNGKRTSIPLTQQGDTERGIINTPDEYENQIPDDVLQSASDATRDVPEPATPVGSGFMGKLLKTAKNTATLPIRAAAAPLAYPGQSAAAVLKQGAERALGAGSQQPSQQSQPDISSTLLQTSANTPQPSNNPFDPSNAEANVQAILKQGGTSKDVADYLSAVKQYQSVQPSSGTGASKPSAQQYSLASSALDSIQNVANMIQKDPDVVNKDATPGQGLPLVGGLVSRAAGTSDYHTQLGNIAQAILHLQTGAAFSAQEKQAVQANLPRAGDSAETIQNKLTTLTQFLSPFTPSSQ